MTPTDALIEKMARAMYATQLIGIVRTQWDYLPDPIKRDWLALARAAYSAEHEEDGK